MNSLLNRNDRLLDLLGRVICDMFQGLLIWVVHVAFLLLDILEKSICKALGKAGEMLWKLKEKVEDAALQRVADESVNAGTSLYNLESDMEYLKSDLVALKCRASDIKEEVANAERSGRGVIKAAVENWLQNVEQLENEFNELERNLREESPWKHLLRKLFGGADVSRMKDRVSSLADESHNFRDLVRVFVENRQNNN